MKTQVSKRSSRPKLVLIISLTLGAIAIAQITLITILLLFGQKLPELRPVFIELSVFDWVAIYGLAIILANSTRHLFRLSKRAISWFSVYIGLGSWAALLYSLSSIPKPHFDELASLGGLVMALMLLAYLHRLRRTEVLR